MRKKLLVSIMIFLRNVSDNGYEIWTQVREEPGPLYKMLEFPGGKIELGESPLEAIDREVQEEVEIDISKHQGKQLFKIQEYSFNEKDIVLYVFISNFDLLPNDKGQWLAISYDSKSEYLRGKIPTINHVIIDELTVYLEKQNRSASLDNLWKQSKP